MSVGVGVVGCEGTLSTSCAARGWSRLWWKVARCEFPFAQQRRTAATTEFFERCSFCVEVCVPVKSLFCVVCREKEGPGRRFAFKVGGKLQVPRSQPKVALALSRQAITSLTLDRQSPTTETDGNRNRRAECQKLNRQEGPTAQQSTAQTRLCTQCQNARNARNASLFCSCLSDSRIPIAGVEIGCDDRWSCSAGPGECWS